MSIKITFYQAELGLVYGLFPISGLAMAIASMVGGAQ